MKNKKMLLFILWLTIITVSCTKEEVKVLDLSGEWSYCLDSIDIGIYEKWYSLDLNDVISLPGTLDDIGAGTPNQLKPTFEAPQIRHLIRKNSYIGVSWYSREIEIPKEWDAKSCILSLERVLYTSRLWFDGKEIGSKNSVSTPHRFTIDSVSAGKHKITFRIDNRNEFDNSVVNMGHFYTDDTQIIWNGILGKMELKVMDDIEIVDVQLFPDAEKRQVKIILDLINHTEDAPKANIKFTTWNKGNKVKVSSKKIEVSIDKERSSIEYIYDLEDNTSLWNEFSPQVYSIEAELKTKGTYSKKVADFGLRKLTTENIRMQINGIPLYLRGTLECCIFPLTGTPPMDEASWERLFGVVVEWGLNHVRFHSWCPPRAAFNVADRLGLYLQVELPWWSYSVGHDKPTNDYMWQEALAIMKEYGNHPSFCFWSMGNELEGNVSMLQSFVKTLKEKDPRHLYTTTTFSFQQGVGAVPQRCDDFFITQWTNNGWVRGQGIFNDESPAFDKDFSTAIDSLTVPIVSHEVGQYSVYPNMKEIEKYTGVLMPLNFIAVREDLKRKGLLEKADDYFMASGKLAVILYKEEIERAMKTDGFSGYQLLDLHDYPGQGTALVGLLDAFWDNKGLVSAQEFRQFSAPVVPLIWFSKATYTNSEIFKAKVGVSNFSDKKLENQHIEWNIQSESGWKTQGKISSVNLSLGNNFSLGEINISLEDIIKAEKLTITVSLKGSEYKNTWNIWVYPENVQTNVEGITITEDLVVAKRALQKGESVLFNPKWMNVNGIEGKFLPVFWSPVHFPNQAGTMGILCDPSHPALAKFPTDMHSNWQWWDLNRNSTTVLLDSISQVEPIVEVVDNFIKNRRLALVFEAKVGEGKLIFSSTDISSNLNNRPVARQMRYSLLNYMQSSLFNPKYSITENEMNNLITEETKSNEKKSSDSIYY